MESITLLLPVFLQSAVNLYIIEAHVLRYFQFRINSISYNPCVDGLSVLSLLNTNGNCWNLEHRYWWRCWQYLLCWRGCRCCYFSCRCRCCWICSPYLSLKSKYSWSPWRKVIVCFHVDIRVGLLKAGLSTLFCSFWSFSPSKVYFIFLSTFAVPCVHLVDKCSSCSEEGIHSLLLFEFFCPSPSKLFLFRQPTRFVILYGLTLRIL